MALWSHSNDDDINTTAVTQDNANVLFISLGGSRKHPPHPSGHSSTDESLLCFVIFKFM